MLKWLRSRIASWVIRSSGFLNSFSATQRGRGRVDRNDRRLLEAYEENPNLYGAVSKSASDVSRANWRVFRVKDAPMRDSIRGRLRACRPLERRDMLRRRRIDTNLVDEVESHPILDMLARGNGLMEGTEVRRLMQIYLEVTGFCFVALGDSKLVGDGTPSEIWVFPRFAFQDRASTQAETIFEMDGSRFRFRSDMVFAIRHPKASRPYQLTGSALGQAVATEVSIDEHAAMTANGRLLHDGKPEVLIVAQGGSQESVASLRAMFDRPGGTAANAGRTHITNSPMELKVERFDEPLADLGLAQLRDGSGKMIRETTGIPPEILGRVENSNRATSAVAAFHYHSMVIDPKLSKIEEAFNCHLMELFPDSEDLVIAYDTTIPADVEFTFEVINAFPEEFSRNEKRAMAAHAPTEDEADDVPPGQLLKGAQIAALIKDVITPYNTGALSEEQARSMLEFVYKIPEAEIVALLTKPEEEEIDDSEDNQGGDPFADPDEDEGDEGDGEEEAGLRGAVVVLPVGRN